MSRHRFFAPVYDDVAVLSKEDAYHARKVLRLRCADEVDIYDGAGYVYRGVVRDDSEECFRVELYEKTEVSTDPLPFCILYLPWMKGERMDWAVQKAVELGAGQIRAFTAERCVGSYSEARAERFRRIIREASRQSGAGHVASFEHVGDFEAATESDCPLKLLFDENAQAESLREALAGSHLPGNGQRDSRSDQVALMTGPEGGFSPQEVTQAAQKGWKPVLLGRRILRCETAPIAALAAVFYHFEWF